MSRLQSLDGINTIQGLKTFAEKILSLYVAEDKENASFPVSPTVPTTFSIHPYINVCPMTVDEAQSCIQEFLSHSDSDMVPINLIKALRSLVLHLNTDKSLENELELLLSSQVKQLFFTPLQQTSKALRNDEEKRKYKQRIERLKILVEENKYRQITSNLDKKIEDDATMKSMMYATSVGLNMIVAPLSFGAFMYFFSGALLDRFFVSNRQGDTHIGGKTGPDIRRVIAGVVSGVLMLFIEMILFVIRNHEMDSSIRKKSRTRKENPFGYSKVRAKKTFT